MENTASSNFILGFASPNNAVFETTLKQIRDNAPAEEALVAKLILDVAGVLAEASGLSTRERDRRLLLIAGCVLPSENAFKLVAMQASRLGSKAHNALRVVLPAELRKFSGPDNIDAPEKVSPALTSGNITDAIKQESIPERDTDRRAPFAVALVGVAAEHDNNRAMLTEARLKPLLVKTVEELSELARTGLCGFVIGSSVWNMAPPPEHEELLKRLSCISTVLFARVAVRGLSSTIGKSFLEIVRKSRCGPVDGALFCQGDGCQLTATDVQTLREVAQLLDDAEEMPFYPLGLSSGEARLLRVVANGFGRWSLAKATVGTLGARELGGGRSSARMYLVKSHDHARPVVVKIDSLERLQEEVMRYRQWIEPWETTVSDAQLHTHLGTSAITYRLQSSPDLTVEPAPTLEDCLSKLREKENWAQDSASLDQVRAIEQDLTTAIARCAERLAELAKKPAMGAIGDPLWRHWPVANLDRLQVALQVETEDGRTVSMAKIVADAAKRMERLHNRASCHGDVHARNILLIDRSPAFVDFAQSGAGHPCYDLACLDGAVRLNLMRMGLCEKHLVAMYHKLYVCGHGEVALHEDFPTVFSSACSRIAISTACRCRATAIRVVEKYGGTLEDYLAAVAITAGYLAVHVSPSSGIERCVLAGIASQARA